MRKYVWVLDMMRLKEVLILFLTLILVLVAVIVTYIKPSPPKEGNMQKDMETRKWIAMDAIQIMIKHGFNCFRLRLFVNPSPRDEWGGFTGNTLEYTINLAKRIKSSGAKLILDLHYSDTWSDPGKQSKPRAWENLDFEDLIKTVYEYSRDVIAAMKNEGVLPDIVQPGNEITGGMLWPDGKIYGAGDPEEQWKKFTQILKAAIQGIKDGAEDKDIKIMIHIHSGGSWETTKWFFENIERHHVEYNIIGLSYYPWWQGTLNDLRRNLNNTALYFDKDILVVETAYPYRPLNFQYLRDANPEYMEWPQTPEGQRQFLADLLKVVSETPNGHGLGVLWWFPESVPVNNLTVWNAGATALFDQNGRILPAIDAFKEFHERHRLQNFLTGGDISALAEIERLGAIFYDLEDDP
ncbi:MAG: glycosyl hydrolase 53 family protein [Candidatus Bathyarchaeia archaeon]